MPVPETAYPRPDHWLVRALRFCNTLDDDHNELSPVKFNVWAANLAAISTVAATIFSFVSGHIAGVEAIWGGMMAWLTQAHATHHFDKHERNLQAARIKDGPNVQSQ
jgi:hypothetical protein